MNIIYSLDTVSDKIAKLAKSQSQFCERRNPYVCEVNSYIEGSNLYIQIQKVHSKFIFWIVDYRLVPKMGFEHTERHFFKESFDDYESVRDFALLKALELLSK